MDRASVGDVCSRAVLLADLKGDDNLHSVKLFIILFAGRCRNLNTKNQTKIVLEETLENHRSRK